VIGIVDYGVCNVGSILNMLKRVGAAARPIVTPAELEGATKLILPGIGAFDAGMSFLAQRGFVEPLREKVLGQGLPILGICLGAQLLTRGSEEGDRPGLAFFDAEVRRFEFADATFKVPHIGWNQITIRRQSALLSDYEQPPRFYFAHSYYMHCADPADVVATTDYGGEFTSIIGHDGKLGVQFHPEKSHRFGMQLMRNFAHAPVERS
jgi:imidazole glycerol-phosphate synthase subunit HisH